MMLELASALPLEPRSDAGFLLSALPTEEHRAHIEDVLERDGKDYLIGIGDDFLGFLSDYWHYAQVLRGHRWERTVVIDVGCSTGFQSVFFQGTLGYVGINPDIRACKALTPNVEFWEGYWQAEAVQDRLSEYLKRKAAEAQALPRFPLSDSTCLPVGIANMSLLYAPEKATTLSLMHRRFERLFIV